MGKNHDRPRSGRAAVTMSWVALVTALASLFVIPSVLGIAAVAFGAIAYASGARKRSVWAMIIGGVSMVSYWMLVPYYA
ncbi:hypothetical protein N6H14_23030 [Paenibacillus sp. CC-CFT747]|nr:hypothetical protein N6H14_23030 [Paenibacillus sp. CC-CFT747]